MASRSAQGLARSLASPAPARRSTLASLAPARNSHSRRHQSSSTATATASSSSSATAGPSSAMRSLPPLLPARARTTPPPLPHSESAVLAALRARTTPAQGLYVVARLHSRDYLLHPRDVLTVPGPLREVRPDGRSEVLRVGSVLKLDRIKEVGSAEYVLRPAAASSSSTLSTASSSLVPASLLPSSLARTHHARPTPALPPHIVQCTLTVMEHTKSPLQRTLLKKRRKGYEKTIQQKQAWTRLRVGDIVLGAGAA